MPVRFPLSTLLSHILVAFTVELDNAFERRLRDSGQTPRVTSFVMWANFMRLRRRRDHRGRVARRHRHSQSADALDARRDGTLAIRVGRAQLRDPARRLRLRARTSPGLGRSPDRRRSGGRGDLASAGRRDRGALGGAIRCRRGRRASALTRADRPPARACAAGVHPDRRRCELDGGRCRQWRDARRRVAGSVVRAPLSCAPRLRARVRTRGRARIAAERQRRARSRREGHEREGRWRCAAASRRKPWRWRRPSSRSTATWPRRRRSSA